MVDLPEPETPVTTTRRSSGTLQVCLRRLCSDASFTTSAGDFARHLAPCTERML